MLILLALANALGFECEKLYADDYPLPPPNYVAAYGVVDLPDIVVVRPVGEVFEHGVTYDVFRQTVSVAIAGRSQGYDHVIVVHTESLPTHFAGAAAFNMAYNNLHMRGTGERKVITPEDDITAALWMNYLDYWDEESWGDGLADWVFTHEMGHTWLAFPEFDRGAGPSTDLLGRQLAHWSYFMDTPNSPMEGNAWIDNQDGTFTTDMMSPRAFSTLDLYMMGLVTASEVEPFFYIKDPDTEDRNAESSPEHRYREQEVTVSGTRVDLTVDDIIAVHGERQPTPAESQRYFSLLTVLLLGPTELVDNRVIGKVYGRQEQWANAWSEYSSGVSLVDFTVGDEGWTLPPLPDEPALVPKGAR